MTRARSIISIMLCLCVSAIGQPVRSYQLAHASSSPLPPSNVVNELLIVNDVIWAGTERGLSRVAAGGTSWENLGGRAPFDLRGISAIAANDSILWAATAYSIPQDDSNVPAGGGLYFSSDQGASWTFVRQPVDAGIIDTIRSYGATGIRSLAITTEANNITYDIAVTNGAVWTANFAGMLRRSTDRGSTWEKVVLPPDGEPSFIQSTDTLTFDLAPTSGKAGLTGNLNHRVFSVYASSDSVLWVGTAGGINKTTDGGQSWRRFSRENQTQPISGNFVVAIREQRWGGRTIIWAATVNAESSEEERGVSFSDDGGANWRTTLIGEFAHNIAVRDSLVYVAADGGLFRTSDAGTTWQRSGSIVDRATGQRFASAALYAVAAQGDTVWVGGPEGSAFTIDSPANPFGAEWTVFRTYQPAARFSETYSYPSPFAPDDEIVRIHYRLPGTGTKNVSIRIFDFAMAPVRTLLADASRSAGVDQDEVWDGRDDRGNSVANGVYFYRIDGGVEDPVWGKIFAIK